jgi:hypothetical protein
LLLLKDISSLVDRVDVKKIKMQFNKKSVAFLLAAAVAGAPSITVQAGCVDWSTLPWEDLQLSSNATLLTFDDPSVAYDEQCHSEVCLYRNGSFDALS